MILVKIFTFPLGVFQDTNLVTIFTSLLWSSPGNLVTTFTFSSWSFTDFYFSSWCFPGSLVTTFTFSWSFPGYVPCYNFYFSSLEFSREPCYDFYFSSWNFPGNFFTTFSFPLEGR